MLPNRFTKRYTADRIGRINQALAVLEAEFKDDPVLTAQEKSRIVKMPDGGLGFVGNLKTKATENLDLLPRKYDDAEFAGDVENTETVRGWSGRVDSLAGRLASLLLLGESDCFAQALFVRRQLKANGAGQGLDANLDEGLRHFFDRSGEDEPVAPPAPK
jgi:hypothetical protein